jgi:peptidoglycan/LPS O-acetylase OafA/YrhL
MNAGINFVRFFLAFNVTEFHLWNSLARGAGPVAVVAFFYLSGYVITQIAQEVYTTAGRAGAFLLNRFLRIYPQYIVAVLLSLAAVYWYPEVTDHINDYMSWPQGLAEWIPQFSIFGLYDSNVRLLPATWSLSTELYYYLLIGLVTGHSRKLTVALFLVSLPVGALCALHILPFDFYGHPVGNGFVFAFGSMTYFYRNSFRVSRRIFAIACAAYLLHTYAIPLLGDYDLSNGDIAGSLVSFSLIIVYLVQNDFKNERFVNFANALGKLSYPMFLTHWTVCVFVSSLFFGGRASYDADTILDGAVYFLSMLAAILACSMLFYQFIDKPVERIRRAIRLRAQSLPS